jgi:DnaD/phage-associated family protein
MKADFIPLPGSFFTQAMPKIQDLAELKTVLYVSYLILRKQEGPYFVTYKELLSYELMAAMGEEILGQALNSAVEHGVLLHSTLNINGVLEDVYSLTADSRQPSAVNIFSLYEQNIGMITPMIAEELKEAEKLYPPQWIEEAFREAVTLNKRSWKYIARILERWASEGKDSGEHRGNAKKGGPDKYIKGKYGHLVKR